MGRWAEQCRARFDSIEAKKGGGLSLRHTRKASRSVRSPFYDDTPFESLITEPPSPLVVARLYTTDRKITPWTIPSTRI